MDFKPLYEDLQHEFDNYRKEKQKDDRDYQVQPLPCLVAQFILSVADLDLAFPTLQERIDKQREEMSQLRSEVVKAQSRQTFAEQRYLPCPHPLSPKAGFWLIYHKKYFRYEELKQTAEGQTNEVKALRARNAEYSASVGAHQMVRPRSAMMLLSSISHVFSLILHHFHFELCSKSRPFVRRWRSCSRNRGGCASKWASCAPRRRR